MPLPISPPMPAIIAARHPPRSPIKGEPPPQTIPHHSPSFSPPLPHRNTPPPSTEEPTNVLTAASSTSPAPSLATLSPGVARGQAPVSSRGRPWRRSMVNRRRLWSTACGHSPQPFPHKNNSEILENPNYLANSTLTFVPINLQSKCFSDFAIRPSVSDYNCRLAPSHLI
jgi:hypothetical protein